MRLRRRARRADGTRHQRRHRHRPLDTRHRARVSATSPIGPGSSPMPIGVCRCSIGAWTWWSRCTPDAILPKSRVCLPRTGHLLVAVPAADDLIELRELVQGQRVERDRASVVLAEHEPLFRLVERWACARRWISIETRCSAVAGNLSRRAPRRRRTCGGPHAHGRHTRVRDPAVTKNLTQSPLSPPHGEFM